jgi:hypothetical protein
MAVGPTTIVENHWLINCRRIVLRNMSAPSGILMVETNILNTTSMRRDLIKRVHITAVDLTTTSLHFVSSMDENGSREVALIEGCSLC